MAYYRINGGRKLSGMISISGAKNAAVAIIPAVILCGEKCTLCNIPDIEDVRILRNLLTEIGAEVDFDAEKGIMTINPATINTQELTSSPMREMRASYYFLGALLGRYGKAKLALPGGCVIGARPIDMHIDGMEKLGADVKLNAKEDILEAKGMLVGANQIRLATKSVGATINIMMAATSVKSGTTIICNPAKEPHIVDVANFLNAMGADVKGAGTDRITINATGKWHGCTYEIIPDQIETGTYMIAAAATKGEVTLQNVIPKHMETLTQTLRRCGVSIEEGTDGERDYLRVTVPENTDGTDIITEPYPGFPTDLQQPMTAFLTTAKGTSTVVETIFESRFNHVKELVRMGADIKVAGRSAVIHGVDGLCGADVVVTDLRAGAALVVAALMAQGESRIYEIKYLDRGYENLEGKLKELGADIERVDDTEV